MTPFLTLALSLFITHVVTDFYLQPASWVKGNAPSRYRSPKLMLHCSVHAIMACIPVLFITQHVYSILCLLLIIAFSHWIIALVKVKMATSIESNVLHFLAFQMAHVIVLLLLSLHISGLGLAFIDNLGVLFTPKNNAIGMAYIVIFRPTSLLITIVLQKYTPSETAESKGLRSGGEMIGYLERLLMLTFIIIGQYAVVGFILAAKSIFRFGELNNAKSHNLTEYVLLGSLTSVTISAMLGIFVKLFS